MKSYNEISDEAYKEGFKLAEEIVRKCDTDEELLYASIKAEAVKKMIAHIVYQRTGFWDKK